jgi:hypothetical protein
MHKHDARYREAHLLDFDEMEHDLVQTGRHWYFIFQLAPASGAEDFILRSARNWSVGRKDLSTTVQSVCSPESTFAIRVWCRRAAIYQNGLKATGWQVDRCARRNRGRNGGDQLTSCVDFNRRNFGKINLQQGEIVVSLHKVRACDAL